MISGSSPKITFSDALLFDSLCVFSCSCLVLLPCAFLLCVNAVGILLDTLPWVSLSPNHMAPTNKKHAASVPICSDAKQPANKKGAKKTSSNAKTSWPPCTKQSSLGFLSSKRPPYQVGTKLLLDTGIYDDDVPEKVINHCLFTR
jgi:hypothetical protein